MYRNNFNTVYKTGIKYDLDFLLSHTYLEKINSYLSKLVLGNVNFDNEANTLY